MMQSLLADRFKLRVHFEQRNEPVLALTLIKPGKLGPNFRPHVEHRRMATQGSHLGAVGCCHLVRVYRPMRVVARVETGTLMVFNWMRTAHAVTNPDLHLDLDLLRTQVHAALDHFLTHVAVCPNCDED